MLAPAPIPLFLLIMPLAGWAGQWLEQYNKPANHWNHWNTIGVRIAKRIAMDIETGNKVHAWQMQT
jgi:hypothetical protein